MDKLSLSKYTIPLDFCMQLCEKVLNVNPVQALAFTETKIKSSRVGDILCWGLLDRKNDRAPGIPPKGGAGPKSIIFRQALKRAQKKSWATFKILSQQCVLLLKGFETAKTFSSVAFPQPAEQDSHIHSHPMKPISAYRSLRHKVYTHLQTTETSQQTHWDFVSLLHGRMLRKSVTLRQV